MDGPACAWSGLADSSTSGGPLVGPTVDKKNRVVSARRTYVHGLVHILPFYMCLMACMATWNCTYTCFPSRGPHAEDETIQRLRARIRVAKTIIYGVRTIKALIIMICAGPLTFDVSKFNDSGTLPTLVYRSESWTKVCSIIFLDSPVGTGFSYSTTARGNETGDLKSSRDVHTFIRKWFTDHPEFISNPLYIGGDSYSGMTVPIVAQEVSNGIRAGVEPLLKLKGYLVGNPVTDNEFDAQSVIPYAHGMGLISDELYEATRKSCGGEYVSPPNAQCAKYIETVNMGLLGINTAHILEPLCFFAAPKPEQGTVSRRFLDEHARNVAAERRYLDDQARGLYLKQSFPPECRSYGYLLSYAWTDDEGVREALGIHRGSVGEWKRCNYGINNYSVAVTSAVPYHLNLTRAGYRALVYNGDHDMTIPFLGTQAWIRSLNFSIVDDWRSWWVEGNIAGFTRTYSNNLTFATVKGGGHTAPEYRPKQCLAMIDRWMSGSPL